MTWLFMCCGKSVSMCKHLCDLMARNSTIKICKYDQIRFEWHYKHCCPCIKCQPITKLYLTRGFCSQQRPITFILLWRACCLSRHSLQTSSRLVNFFSSCTSSSWSGWHWFVVSPLVCCNSNTVWTSGNIQSSSSCSSHTASLLSCIIFSLCDTDEMSGTIPLSLVV